MNSAPSCFSRSRFALMLGWLAIFAAISTGGSCWGAEAESKGPPAVGEPLNLDTNAYYKAGNENERSKIKAFHGPQVIDGLRFSVGGRIPLYGKFEEKLGRVHPESAKGISVDRRFAELHLIHFTYLPDVEGDPVVNLILNYDDGSAYSVPIRYGVHLRDWYNLPSYEKETLSDPDSMICWRHAPFQFKAPVRLFKTKIVNPLPEKQVKTIDVISAKNLASYVLLAATVVDADDVVKTEIVGDRDFDERIAVAVVDDVTGEPIAGALVEPTMTVQEEGVYGTPIRTNAKGMGVIPYPKKETRSVWLSVTKDGYQRTGQSWSDTIPKNYSVRLKPIKQ